MTTTITSPSLADHPSHRRTTAGAAAVGALTLPVLDKLSPATPVAACPYCGVGCVLTATVEDNRVTRIVADPAAAPNRGMMCPKGALLARVFDESVRITQPRIRREKGGQLEEASWDEAVTLIAERLREAREQFGPGSLAWYGSGQLDSEASYVFTKFFKGFLGTNHTDTNSRLCMSSAVAGYKQAFGADGPPTCYDDIPEADVFFISGANMAVNHPVLFNMVRRRRATADHTRIVVVDPRRTKTAEYADLHLPVKPGGDVALMKLIARRLLDRGAADLQFLAAHTADYAAFLDDLAACDEAELLATAGVDAELIDAAADAMANAGSLLSFYCMGLNQSTHGTDNNTSIINLHLMLGQVGKPGAGPFSLTGQPNAMGGREVGYLSNQLPGYRVVNDSAHRAEMEGFWGLEFGSISDQPGYTAVPMFEAAAAGQIKAMWIACSNPVVSMPNADAVKAALREVPFVVVQDINIDSEVVAYADVVLPATQWGEKVGTMTNSERLVVRSHRFLDPPGQCRPDWWAPAAVARAMGFKGFDYRGGEDVWDEYRRTTAGRPCDMSGMTNARLSAGPLRWPCPSEEHPGTPRRYTDLTFATPDGKARLTVGSAAGPQEPADDQYPFLLTTGRIATHWHTRTKTGLVPELNRQEPDPFIEIHPDDAAAHGVDDGQWLRLRGKRGAAIGKARYTMGVRRGLLFMPFHWGDAYHPQTAANALTNPAHDPVSSQPELKACAVRIEGTAPNPNQGATS